MHSAAGETPASPLQFQDVWLCSGGAVSYNILRTVYSPSRVSVEHLGLDFYDVGPLAWRAAAQGETPSRLVCLT